MRYSFLLRDPHHVIVSSIRLRSRSFGIIELWLIDHITGSVINEITLELD